jgi:hypothetical protein
MNHMYDVIVVALAGAGSPTASAVSQRRREIGVRLALGAAPADVRWLVLKQGLLLAAVGRVAGAGLAIVLARNVEARLFGVTPWDLPGLLFAALGRRHRRVADPGPTRGAGGSRGDVEDGMRGNGSTARRIKRSSMDVSDETPKDAHVECHFECH